MASLTLVGSANCPPSQNLVVNGSFENGHPGTGPANQQYWATGTGGTPFLGIPGWSGSGPANNYALWGSDQTTGPFHLRDSDILPDGQTGVYFGNGDFRNVSETPVFNPDFSVSFANPPVFSGFQYAGPTILSQTIPTQLNPAPSYCLSFWVSGEFSDFSTTPTPGIFGMRLLNTLVGDPVIYLSVPPGVNSTIGKSHVYEFDFTPLDNSQPVTLEFINHGHVGWTGGPFSTTELVLDDVRIMPEIVPEPSSIALMGLVILTLAKHRRVG